MVLKVWMIFLIISVRKDSCILCIDENVNFPNNGFEMAWMIFPRNNILAFYVYNDWWISK